MKIIGLTGGSGTGKGMAADIFQKFGIPAIDTDAVYHKILTFKNPCTEELVAAFGDHISTPSGGIDRTALRRTVFGQPNTQELLHTLNGITHKYIMAKTRKLLHDHEKNGAVAAIVDAPLLFEAGADRLCDVIVGVIADRKVRIARICARDGLTEADAQRRINAQHEDAFYIKNCHVILYNNTTAQNLEAQIHEFIKKHVVQP